jgi:uncharacterized repeat protein (TIGR03806 family)
MDYVMSPPKRLSELCVLENRSGDIVSRGDAVEYELNAPLFTDYAVKTRILWIPPGTAVSYDAADVLKMPVGTLITKTFAFPADLRAPDLDVSVIETRVLLRKASGWSLLPYVWNAAQDDATLADSSETRDITFVDAQGVPRTAHYFIPAERDCHECHDSAQGIPTPIGPSARQLNRDHVYADGTENQLAHWARLALLEGAPDPSQAPRLAGWNEPEKGTLERRARAYLEGNCAHCHNGAGLSANTDLYLRADEAVPEHFGVCKPTGDLMASGGLPLDIVPGNPDASALVFRLASTDPQKMMPQIGRSLVHAEGLELVREWISGLPGSCSPSVTDAGASTTDAGSAADGGVASTSDAGDDLDGGGMPDAGSDGAGDGGLGPPG